MIKMSYLMSILYFIILFHKNDSVHARSKKTAPKLQEIETRGGEPGNAGFDMILTKKGLDYANSYASEMLNEMLTKLAVPDTRQEIDGGFVEASNLHITKFVPPTYGYRLIPESQVQWGMQGASVFLNGQWRGEKKVLFTFKFSGEFEASAADLEISLTINFEKTPDGKPLISDPRCTSKIGTLNIKIKGGFVGWVINLFKSLISKRLKPILETEICSKAVGFIQTDMNKKLQSYSTMLPVSGELRLDMSLAKNPTTANNTFETKHNGQISFMGLGGTPFYPHAVQAQQNGGKMINIFISDYILNSFFHHAHENHMIQFLLENETFLDLRCPEGFCLGDLMPLMAAKYPESSKTAIQVKTLEAPTTQFANDKASVHVKGIMQIFVLKPGGVKTVALNALLDMTSELTIRVKGMNVTGEIDIAHFELNLINATVAFLTSEPLRALADLIQPFIRVVANNELNKGIPLKLTKGVILVNPVVRFSRRTLQIYSDIAYNPNDFIDDPDVV